MSLFTTSIQVHEFDISTAVLAVLWRDVHPFPVVEDAVAHGGGQGARVHAADYVPSTGVRAPGARSALRSRRGGARSIRTPAHRLPAFRVPRTSGPVLLWHVRDAHLQVQALSAGEQGRQYAGIINVPGACLDRYIPGRLSVRYAHRICN